MSLEVALVPSDQVNLVNFDHALPEAPGHVLGIVFVQAEFVSSPEVAQVQAHQVEAYHPLPQGLVVTGEHGAGEVTELPGVIPALSHDVRRVAV